MEQRPGSQDIGPFPHKRLRAPLLLDKGGTKLLIEGALSSIVKEAVGKDSFFCRGRERLLEYDDRQCRRRAPDKGGARGSGCLDNAAISREEDNGSAEKGQINIPRKSTLRQPNYSAPFWGRRRVG